MVEIPRLTDIEINRFWEKVDVRGSDDCWIWKPSRDSDYDYGSYGIRRGGVWTIYRTNRLALFIKTGLQGESARHSCNNTKCCNPNHLSWGSHFDNMQDKVDSNRQHIPSGTDNGRAILQESDIISIREEFKLGKVTKVQLGLKYGVTDSNIRRIIQRKTWQHVS